MSNDFVPFIFELVKYINQCAKSVLISSINSAKPWKYKKKCAGIAQSVVQLIRNR